MLTNFFGKSNPINFFVCAAYLFLTWVGSIFVIGTEGLLSKQTLLSAAVFVSLLFTMLLLDFIIRKNALTQINTFAIIIWVSFVAMFPVLFSEINIVLAAVFILLALRRIVSLGSERNIEKKLLDASLYIMVASIFHFWCVLFLVPLYWAITRISSSSFRLLFIPLVGVFTVLIFTVTYHLIRYDSLAWFNDWFSFSAYDFSSYNSLSVLIPTAVIGALFLWVIVVRVLRVASLPRKLQDNYKIITFIMVLSLVVSVLSPVKSGAELLFLMAPLAIAATNYIERVKDFWFQEALLWLLVLLPFGLFFLSEI